MAAVGTTAAADADPELALGAAVERSYQVFAHNRVGPSMVVRRADDVSPADIAALGGVVRAVPAVAIDRWLPHAVTTWGTAEDLRALLPRVFELLTAGLLAAPPELVLAKVRQADSAGWPIDEVAAVDDIVSALWLATITKHPATHGHPAWRVLAGVAELGWDLGSYLDDWLLLVAAGTPASEPARRHLADLARRVHELAGSDLDIGAIFWSPHPAEAERLERWITSPLVTGHLDA
jgi:hypothetical protein